MSATVDSRVLEMRFDNKEFEANAQETINTLNTLKRALDENVNGSAFEELDRAARNVDLSSIEHSLDSLTDRFSTLGIVGMRVIENLTDGLMNLVHRGLNYVTDAISSGGIKRAMNIENARFQLQGLIDDEKEVEAIMKNAQQSVSDTAYSYDEAAKAASMFAATGLRSGEQMQSALDGIAGVAATTNSDYESMAQIFTTVAGNGRLMGDQLLQLSTRGMNAAAVLRNFFNEVRDGSRDASDHVKDLVNQLSGMNTGASDVSGNTFDNYDDAIASTQKAFNKQYKERQKALNKEFEVIKKGYDEEYNSLKKTLDSEYNAKKKAYDEEYQALSESLSKEIQEVQKANAQRLKEANEAYSEQVNAYREATEARIQLINDEYLESIKLIDEERYNKLKAIDDELKAMQELEEAESRQRINEANAEKKATIEDLANRAKSKRARLEAAEAVADVNKAIADQQEAWRKEDRKKELSEQKDQINEDANLKKQEALSKKDAAVKSVQDEASAKLKEMQKAHEVEIEQMRESQQVQIEELQKSKQAQLETLRESQQNELSQYRETQQLQLQSFRETQQEELEAIRERNQEELEALRELNNDKLSEMKEASKVGVQALKDFNGEIGFTEEQIRDMVSKGLIDFETFAEAMDALFGDHAKDANKTFSGAMANIRAALSRTGAMFVAPFLEQEGPMVQLFNNIRIKINEMNAALAPLAKVITDNILSVVVAISEWVESIEIKMIRTSQTIDGHTQKYHLLYTIGQTIVNVFSSILNIFSAIGSYIRPVIDAFTEVFTLDWLSIWKGTVEFDKFTESLRASGETAKVIHDAFTLFFTLIKNGISIVINFVKEFKPLHTLVSLLASGINFLATGISMAIGSFVEWIATCKPLQDVLKSVVEGLNKFVDKLKEVKNIISEFLKDKFGGFDLGSYFAEGFLAGFQKMGKAVIEGIISFFNFLKEKVQEVFGIESPSKWAMWIVEMIFEGLKISFEFLMNDLIPFVVNLFRVLINAVTGLVTSIDWVGIFTNISNYITRAITNITDTIANGIPIVLNKISDFFHKIEEDMRNFKFEKGEGSLGWNIIFAIIDGMHNAVIALGSGLYKIAKTMYDTLAGFFRNFSIKDAIALAVDFVKTFASTLVEKLGEWKETVSKALQDFFGNIDSAGILAIGSGIAIIYMFIKACHALFKLMTPMAAVVGAINGLKQAFLGFAWDMKANALLKMSVSIAIISATIGLMFKLFQQVNDEKAEDDMLKAVGIVSAAVLAIGTIVTATSLAAAKINTAEGAIGQIGIAFKKIAAALEVKIIIASVVSALSAIILDIAALATIYAADKDAFNAAIDAITDIGKKLIILIAAILVISGIMTPSNLQTFAALTGSLLAFSASVILIVLAIQKITSMEIRKSDLTGLALLTGIIVLVGSIISDIMSAASSGNGAVLALKIGTIISFALLMVVAIQALKKLIKEGYSISKDYPQLLMLAALMGIITLVCFALAKAGTDSEESVKYGGAVIGLAALLLASIYAIKKLIEIPFDDYIKGLGKLALLFATMAIAVFSASTVTSNDGYKSILAVGILVGALLVVMGVLSMLDPAKSLISAALLGGLLIALGFALSGAGELAVESAKTFSSLMVMLGMIIAIAIIMRMLLKHDWKEMLAVCGSIALVLVGLGTAMKLASGTKFNLSQIGAFIAGLIVIAAIGAILSRFKIGDWKKTVGLGATIGIVLVSMGEAMKLIGSSNVKIGGGQVAAIIFGIVAIAAIGKILTSLQAQDWKSMLSIAATISLVLLALGAAIMLMGESKYGVSAGAVAAFIAGIVGVIVIGVILTSLQTQDWQSMLALAGAISLVLVAMGAAIMLMGDAKYGVSAGAAASMILGLLAVAVVGAVIGLCAKCDWLSMISLGAAISEVLLAMGAAIRIMGSGDYSLDKGSVTAFIIGLVAAAIVGVIIGFCALQPWDQMIGLGTAISEVLLAMGAAIRIMGDTKVDESAMVAFGLGVLAVWGIAAIVQKYSEGLDLKECLALSTGVAIVLVALAIVTAILGKFGKGSLAGAAEGAAALDVIVAIIGALIVGIGALYQIKGFKEIMEAGAEGLAKIGEAIGGFFGGIAKGFSSEILELIPLLGTKLSEFTENSKDFFDMLKGFDEGMGKAALAFSGVLLAIGAAEILDAVSNLIGWFTGGGDLSSYGDKLAAFGASMQTFYDNTKDIENPYRLKTIAEGAKSLLELGQLVPNEGGLLGDIMGNNPLDKFGDALASFSEDLVTVDANFAEVANLDRFQLIADAMKCIIEMAKSIPNEGGLAATVFGDNNIGLFGSSLVTFSRHLRTVGVLFGEVTNLDLFDDVAKAMDSIIRMAINIPNSGGLAETIFGDNNIETFGINLREFAKQICAAAVYAESANLDIMDTLAESMKKMISVAKYIKDNGLGEGNWFTKLAEGGDNSLVGFGETLLKFSRSISEMTTNGNLDNIDKFQKLVTTLERFTNITGVLMVFNGNNFINFLNDLGNKGAEGVNKFLNAFDGIDAKINDAVTKLFIAIKSVMEKESNLIIFKIAGRSSVLAFADGLSDDIAIMAASVKMITTLASELTSSRNELLLQIAGMSVSDSFAKGLAFDATIKPAANNLIMSLQSALTDKTNSVILEIAGKANVMEYISGFSDKSIIKSGAFQTIGLLSKELITIINTALIKASGKVNIESFLTGFINEGLISKAAFEVIGKFLAPELLENIKQALIVSSGKITIENFVKGLNGNESRKTIHDASGSLISFLSIDLMNPLNSLKIMESSRTLMEVFSKAMNSNEVHNNVKESSDELTDFIARCLITGGGLAGGSQGNKKFVDAGKEDANAFLSGFDYNKNRENFSNTMWNFAVDVSNVLYERRVTRLFEDAGKNAVYGFSDGLRDSRAMDDVRNAAQDMAYEAYDSAMEALDANSPSRKMMQVGGYAGEGFAIGFEDWVSSVGEIGEDIGETAIDGLKDALKNISSEIQNGDDFNPVITPVLDLSNIENGVGQIGGMLDINDPIRFNTSNIVNPMTTQTDQLREGYMMGAQFMFDKMSEELEYYKEQNSQLMSTMSDYLSHLQVVMDTGELVGVLTNPIDNELGFNKVLNARGVR